MKNNCCCTVLR